MSILDRIKNLFNKNRKALPEPQIQYQNNRNIPNNTYFLPRQDGSTLEITPVLDDLGHQSCEQVYNSRTKQMQTIRKFSIMHDVSHGRTMQSEILMDIDPELLNNPKYADFIANEMLSEQRISKVINEYGNYAGTIIQSENGILGKAKDEGIIKTLNREKSENAKQIEEDRKKAENARNDAILKRAEARGISYDTNPEGPLSGQEWTR